MPFSLRSAELTVAHHSHLSHAMIFTSLCLAIFILNLIIPSVNGQFEWHTMDQFDQIRKTLDSVNSETCKIVDRNSLLLPSATVTHVPDLKTLGIDPIYPNRTNLVHVHNMALARAFFQSFILQKASDESEPGFMYLFLSAVSDVAANRFINASAIYYGPHMAFTPSYKGFYNKTMPLFAPRAYRTDDFNDPYHLQGTSTLNTIEVTDLGAVPNNSQSRNYTNDQYKINEWYSSWLPDQTKRQDSKETYQVRITYANGQNESFTWHGPPAASSIPGPVKWVRPYYDCDRSNKWVYGATSPIVDIFPRHTGWRHIERPLYVAVSVMEIDFERIDINQCPVGEGNPSPNYFAGTARCKNMTTECEPIHGFGFRRGGYQCRCRPGFRLPRVAKTPFLGETVERATSAQYNREFECERIGYLGVRTQNVQKLSKFDRNMLLSRVQTLTGLDRNKSQSTDPAHIIDLLRRPDVNRETCRNFSASFLTLRGDVAFGKEEQLENQARMALRLANFISAFLQLVDPKEQFAEFREPDKPLTEDQVIGEALAVVIGDRKILGCSVEFDRNRFINRTVFAPLAYRKKRNDREFHVIDQARPGPGNHDGSAYLKSNLFEHLKNRFATFTYELPTFTAKINVRYNSSGLYAIKYDHYPLNYKAAELDHGYWSQPYYDCHGVHHDWIVKFGVPFFGWDRIHARLEFKGIVTVTMKLDELDINQCPDEFYVPNAFKNSHKCDRRSTRCVPILGRKFETGGYKCECEQGFEYPFNDPITYFDGQIMEAEYGNLLQDQPSRFDTLRCRIAGALTVTPQSFHQLFLIISLPLLFLFLFS